MASTSAVKGKKINVTFQAAPRDFHNIRLYLSGKVTTEYSTRLCYKLVHVGFLNTTFYVTGAGLDSITKDKLPDKLCPAYLLPAVKEAETTLMKRVTNIDVYFRPKGPLGFRWGYCNAEEGFLETDVGLNREILGAAPVTTAGGVPTPEPTPAAEKEKAKDQKENDAGAGGDAKDKAAHGATKAAEAGGVDATQTAAVAAGAAAPENSLDAYAPAPPTDENDKMHKVTLPVPYLTMWAPSTQDEWPLDPDEVVDLSRPKDLFKMDASDDIFANVAAEDSAKASVLQKRILAKLHVLTCDNDGSDASEGSAEDPKEIQQRKKEAAGLKSRTKHIMA